jgi:D-glycero-D-manno-heptose 1,7-bisphosphate phosphatase
MNRPAIFFDRDNTLIVSNGCVKDPAEVRLVAGAADAVARARAMGFAVVTVSNQSGVARGMLTEEDVQAVNERVDELLRAEDSGAIVDRHEYCPYHPEGEVDEYRAESELRKPKPGMLQKAASEMKLDLSRSWMIGDAPRDIAAGEAAGCATILFRDPSLPPSPAADEGSAVSADFSVDSLEEAMDMIQQQLTHRAPATEIAAARSKDRLEQLAEQILHELRRRDEHAHSDFSVPRLMAGIVEVLALAALFLSYLNRNDSSLQPMLTFAMVLQTLVVALLLMGRRP